MIVLSEVVPATVVANERVPGKGDADIIVPIDGHNLSGRSPQDLGWQTAVAIAQQLGIPTYTIPATYTDIGQAEALLAAIPAQSTPTPTIWLGHIPAPERYTDIYNAALDKGLRLLNTPDEHLTVQEFDRAYPLLQGLTPDSVILTTPEQWERVPPEWGFPLFVKGAVQSRKAQGWSACVAHNPDELRCLVTELLTVLAPWSRGRAIVRRLVPLRHHRVAPDGFPLGREFRLLFYRQQLLSYGYVWEGDDPDKFLSLEDEATMLQCATAAMQRLPAPFVSLDLAQLTDGTWTVIETGDPQFSAFAHLPPIQVWQELEAQLAIAHGKWVG